MRRAMETHPERRARLIHLVILALLQSIMAVELIFLILDQHWLHVFLIVSIMTALLSPVLLKDRLPAPIPPEIQILAILFVFAALFLGEVRDYYARFWWWDMVLHGTAGLLLGLLGFLVVYILNEDRHVDMHMRPSFLALFAFSFSQCIGAPWTRFSA